MIVSVGHAVHIIGSLEVTASLAGAKAIFEIVTYPIRVGIYISYIFARLVT